MECWRVNIRLPHNARRGDEEIAAATVARLGWDVAIPRVAVQVRVEQGWVTLPGEVDW